MSLVKSFVNFGNISADNNKLGLELFHLPTLMHNSLFINNIYVTLLPLICFKH